jgi:DNA-binding transcriptional ArsR family regulator
MNPLPLRIRILRALELGPMTAKQLARALDVHRNNVYRSLPSDIQTKTVKEDCKWHKSRLYYLRGTPCYPSAPQQKVEHPPVSSPTMPDPWR